MANISYGVNILPKTNNTYTLGNSDYKWNIYGKTIDTDDIIANNKITSGTRDSQASEGYGSLAVGESVVASGYYSTAFGNHASAQSIGSFAQGYHSAAVGLFSTAMGGNTTALYRYTVAIGMNNTVRTIPIWTSGTTYNIGDIVRFNGEVLECTETNSDTASSPAISKWKIHYGVALVVGNGEMGQSASNALTLLYDGRLSINGDMYVNANADGSGGDKVLTSVPVMTGATSSTAGASGLVPAPATTDVDKFLRGDGTWTEAVVDVSGKADKDTSATEGNLAEFDANGNPVDSGFTGDDLIKVQDATPTNPATKIWLPATAPSGIVVPTADEVAGATSAQVKAGTETGHPVTPSVQHNAVFYGLAKLAGVDLALSSNAVGTFPDDAKIAIQKMLGIYDAPWELIANGTVTNAATEDIEVTLDNNNTAFQLTDVFVYVVVSATESAASYGDYGKVRYYYTDNNYEETLAGNMSVAVGASDRIFYAGIERQNGATRRFSTTNNSHGNNGNIAYFATNNASSQLLPFTINDKRYYNKIVFRQILGKVTYRIYGKRRWD